MKKAYTTIILSLALGMALVLFWLMLLRPTLALARPNAPAIGEEINVLDGSTDIPNGTGLVDFGSTPAGIPLSKTFTISNSGFGSLILFEPILVPSGFSVVEGFAGLTETVLPGETTTFTVQLDAAAQGSYSGSLTFLNSDADETPYQFTIQGEVLGPEIATLENGALIPDGTGLVDFGPTPLYSPITKTFTISNSGAITLNLIEPISVPTGFSVPDSFGRTAVPAGETTTFTVQLDAAATGSYSGALEFANDDADENPYTFTISGTVAGPDLGITKSVTPTEALPGATITYTLAFSNAGNGIATGVVITDSIPVSVTQSSLSYIYAGAEITVTGGISYVWSVEDLSAGEWGVITITGQLGDPLATGSFTNTAEISTDSTGDDTANNTAAVGMTVIPPFAWVNGVYYATLQDAIDAANPGDEVRLVGGEAIPEVETVAGLTQTGYITKSLTIRGGYSRANGFAGPPDPDNLALIDAGGNGRALVVTGTVEVTLVNLRLTGGDAAAGGGFSDRGGGLAIQGAAVTLDNSDIVSNTASGGGGGIYLGSILTVTNGSVISANIATGSGGGIYISPNSTVTLDASSVLTNTASVDGGGVYNNNGSLTLKNGAHIDDNHADDDGGGIYNTSGGSVTVTGAATTLGQDGIGNTANDKGGGICTMSSGSTLTVQDGAHVEGNVADYDQNTIGEGGGIYNVSSGVVTVGDAIVSYNSGDRGGGIYNSAALTLQNGAHVDDNAARSGGGLYDNGGNSVVDASVIADNLAEDQGGGGVFHRAGVLIVQNGSSIEDNTSAGSHSNGGGIYVNSRSDVWVSHSAVISNTAAGGNGDGGAFYNAGHITVTNSTVSGNTADYRGGGLYNFVSSGTGTVTLRFATVAYNTASDGGGIYRWNGLVTISNTIIANNSGTAPDCKGTITSGDYNLVGDTTGCSFTPAANDITNQDPGLGPLQDNGGNAWTHALLDGSPAMDKISTGTNGCDTDYTSDQRGATRPTDGDGNGTAACDIGAFELGGLQCGIQAAVEPATYTFLGNVSLQVTDDGTNLDCLRVTDIPWDHPNATSGGSGAGIRTGKYWIINGLQGDRSTAATAGYALNLTLPHSVSPHGNAKVCKYPGGLGGYGWDCARDSSTASTVTRNGISSLSDWAVGDQVGPTAITQQRASVRVVPSTKAATVLAVLATMIGGFVLALWKRRS